MITVMVIVTFVAIVAGSILGPVMEYKAAKEHREWLAELEDYDYGES